MSESTLRITKKLVDGLEATGKTFFVWDRDLAGFGLSVTAMGKAGYVIQYRAGSGRGAATRRMKIGNVGTLTPEEARQAARALLAEVALGGDPARTRTAKRKEITVAELSGLYLTEGCMMKKPSTLLNDRGRLDCHILPLVGNRKIGDIGAQDVERLLRDVADGKTARDVKTGPKGRSIVRGGRGAATQAVRLLSSMLSFAVSRKLLRVNPALGVRTFKVRKCERFLSSDELSRIGEALRAAEAEGIAWRQNQNALMKHRAKDGNDRTRINPFAAAALRLLLLTGARLREILNLEWSHVDFERGLLLLPDSKTGKKQIALNAPALAVLAGLPRIGRHVIASETAGQPGEKPRSDLHRPWRMVCRAAGIEGVRIHDLRHTHASIAAAAGLGLPIIGKLLGHTQASTTARYAHLADDPVRRASERIGSDIAAALGEARLGAASIGGSVEPIRKSKLSEV